MRIWWSLTGRKAWAPSPGGLHEGEWRSESHRPILRPPDRRDVPCRRRSSKCINSADADVDDGPSVRLRPQSTRNGMDTPKRTLLRRRRPFPRKAKRATNSYPPPRTRIPRRRKEEDEREEPLLSCELKIHSSKSSILQGGWYHRRPCAHPVCERLNETDWTFGNCRADSIDRLL